MIPPPVLIPCSQHSPNERRTVTILLVIWCIAVFCYVALFLLLLPRCDQYWPPVIACLLRVRCWHIIAVPSCSPTFWVRYSLTTVGSMNGYYAGMNYVIPCSTYVIVVGDAYAVLLRTTVTLWRLFDGWWPPRWRYVFLVLVPCDSDVIACTCHSLFFPVPVALPLTCSMRMVWLPVLTFLHVSAMRYGARYNDI